MRRALVILALLPALAWGQAVVVTNDILWLDPAAHPLGATLYRQLQYDVYARQNAAAYDLSGLSNVWSVYDGAGTNPIETVRGTVQDATNGHVRIEWTPVRLVDGWAKLNAYQDGSLVAALAWDNLSVTSSAIAAGGCSPVQVDVAVVISNITGGSSGGGGIVSNVVETAGTNRWIPATWTILLNTNAVGTGGGTSGITTLNGLTGNLNFAASSPLTITASGTNLTIAYTPIATSLIGSNIVAFSYTGGDQTWEVPAGISNIIVRLWGGGGPGTYAPFNGVGGYTWVFMPANAGAFYTLKVAQGGQYHAAGTYTNYTFSPYPNGGRGCSTSMTAAAYSGGGASMIIVTATTQLIAIAGGAGAGTQAYQLSGYGGGSTGANGGSSAGTTCYGGGGGSQSAGGTAYSTNTAIYQPSAGSYLQGGDGGYRSNVQAHAYCSGYGGGGGYYGGGGSIHVAAAAETEDHAGGGGSGYVNLSLITAGETLRQTGVSDQVPIGQDVPGYIAGRATRATSATANAGNGLILICY